MSHVLHHSSVSKRHFLTVSQQNCGGWAAGFQMVKLPDELPMSRNLRMCPKSTPFPSMQLGEVGQSQRSIRCKLWVWASAARATLASLHIHEPCSLSNTATASQNKNQVHASSTDWASCGACFDENLCYTLCAAWRQTPGFQVGHWAAYVCMKIQACMQFIR